MASIVKKKKQIEEFLKLTNICFVQDKPLKYEMYFKTGGRCHFYILPTSQEQLSSAVSYLESLSVNFKLIGGSTNVVFFDDATYDCVISTKLLTNIKIDPDLIFVDSGYSTYDFVRVLALQGKTGHEGLEGIPGSIGGAIYMNAGAYGYCISDYLVYVKVMDLIGNITIFTKKECEFTYRKSIFMSKELVILEAAFNYPVGNREQTRRKIEEFHIARHSYQEFALPNLGSMISIKSDIYKAVFRTHPLYSAAYLAVKIIYKNPLSKFLRRKRPTNKEANRLLLSYLKSRGHSIPVENISHKSANVLINNGLTDTKDYLAYITILHSLLENKHHVENEFVFPEKCDAPPVDLLAKQ